MTAMRHALLQRLTVAVLAVGVIGGVAGCRPAATRALPPAASLSLAEVMGGDPAGFARAVAPRPFDFPTDHGPHRAFRSEWWYFTGNLTGADGAPFGFQLTFFRHALSPPPADGLDGPNGHARDEVDRSRWRAQELYMAHLAIGDARGGRFRHAERFARGALGLAGAAAEPFRVWLEGWSAETVGADFLPLRLRAAAGEGAERLALDLHLGPGKPPVAQGDRGLSRKGPEPGNASHYYSFTRLPATGRLTLGEREVAVQGLAWMDREWSTSALGPGLVGWDWFALQLDDGRDLMLYRLRRADGGSDPWSAGTRVDARGEVRPLAADAVRLTPLASWRSPRGGTYPVRWRIEIPAEGLDLAVTARLDDQEIAGVVRYWEGAVTVAGHDAAGAVAGSGFLEMTGYAEGAPRLAR